MKKANVAIVLVGGTALSIVAVTLINFIQKHPQVVIVIVALIALIAALMLVYAIYMMVNRIHGAHSQIMQRRTVTLASVNQIDLARADQEHRWLMEERRLELEERKLKLEAYKAQAVHVGHGQALVLRDYSGLGSRVAYEHQVKVHEVPTTPELEMEEHLLLEAPTPRTASALSLLHHGELDGDELVLGTDRNGQLVRKSWKQLMGILILGLMGGGKTNTSLWVLLQLILKGYQVALIDRHAKSDESTHARLKDFARAYDTPVGDSPVAAARVVRHVRAVFESRRDKGVPVSYRLVLMIDEFSATMRAMKDNTSEWQAVAIELAGLIEDLGYEGRKYGVHVIAAGQATNASRSGGTEIRDMFHTRIVHGMRARQAQNIGLTDDKATIQKLETGQTIIDIEGKDDPFFCAIPEVTAEFKQAVLNRFQPRRTSRNLAEKPAFTTGSTKVQAHPLELINEPPMNLVQHSPEPVLSEVAERVLQLKKSGMSKNAIILEIWQAKKGGSEQYKRANEEYTHIVENLVARGYLPATL